ncbi:NADPH-adrenodoxin reductase [Saccharomycopsis crataegensis]|uniref:NADPH:adrenodoxin oxidoreductase, mitochondrial n=1 Tax=Saccharomycopsis crataegensis TaxID=43959 RepID=A0AAV5QMZ5_9ASCO|nr:NADPH-adrenodoxin reductase [Saccharomycopsis crataegensis]
MKISSRIPAFREVFNRSGVFHNPRALFQARQYSAEVTPPIQIAVVGSGPSAFYTVLHILQKQNPKQKVCIDIFEKWPVPFGLSRYGVAPDHPEVKNCENKFEEIIERASTLHHTDSTTSEVNFYGNVEIGKDVSLRTLKDYYNMILFAYGCSDERSLAVPGANLPGVISSRKLVGWYNGLPDSQNLDPPLDKVEDVTIIGNGNVALDIARVLLAPHDEVWENTDLGKKALEKLKKSTVKRVRIVARRGFSQSAFTNKEFRELLELTKHGIYFQPIDPDIMAKHKLLKGKLVRAEKRRLDMMEKYFKQHCQNGSYVIPEGSKTWSLEYLKSPAEIYPNTYDKTILSATKFQINKLKESLSVDESKGGKVEIVSTDESVTVKNELLITSIGYKGLPLETMDGVGIDFDMQRGVISNARSRVVDKHGDVLDGLFVTGWIQHGPSGVIASTMMNSFATGSEILKDLSEKQFEAKSGFKALEKHFIENNIKYTKWDDWKKIDERERELGSKSGKVRDKILSVDEMFAICDKK